MRDKVEEVLNQIRPSLMMDGGNVELVAVDDGVVKVPDYRLDGLAEIHRPRKTTHAEITFVDVGCGAAAQGLDRSALTAMRDVDALCHVVRAFADPAGTIPTPLRRIACFTPRCLFTSSR